MSHSDVFGFLVRTVLDDVFWNSLIVIILTSFGVLFIGVSTAWCTVRYSFWGRRFLSWALFMPLAFPAYIMAYIYTDFFDEAGEFSAFLSSLNMSVLLPDFRSISGAAFILTFCLYPYVYLFARNGFIAGSKSQIESASLLGGSTWSQFFDVGLPAARPFIIVGLTLVIMETLADYGTMDYFGLRVFSTVIYDAWAGYDDIAAAARLSFLLLAFVIMLVFFEKYQRGRMKFYADDASHSRGLSLKKGNIYFTIFCFIPVFIGFVFPIILLLHMVFENFDLNQMFKTFPYIYNTLLSAFIVAIFGVCIAFLLTTAKHNFPNLKKNILFNICGFGYALPGIILGLGLLLLSSVFSSLGILITGTFIFLILGYLIRFLNVGLQGLDAGYDKISPSIGDASSLMQRSFLDNFWHIKLPLLWPAMLSSALIFAVEVIKELPLTLVLRPFNFDTLAVHTYNLASDERLGEAAFPAVCIVFAGCIPVLLLQRLSRKS